MPSDRLTPLSTTNLVPPGLVYGANAGVAEDTFVSKPLQVVGTVTKSVLCPQVSNGGGGRLWYC